MQIARPAFDVKRAVLEDYLDTNLFPAHLTVTGGQPLAEALSVGTIQPDTHLLTFTVGDRLYAFPMQVVLSYNVIQGRLNDASGIHDWMMTFCNACNTGMVFDPRLDGQTLHFHRRGSYDGLLLIWDKETNSYWQHVTGECLHGPSVGRQLEVITLTRQMTAVEAAAQPAAARLITHELTPLQVKLSRAMERMRAQPERAEEGIFAQITASDDRLPRFALGLGVWNDLNSLYVPFTALNAHNNAVLLPFDGRRLLVYQAPDAISPVALYVDETVSGARWERDVLKLSGAGTIANDVWTLPDGSQRTPEKPAQLLMRWFGFALTFPGTVIGGV